MTDENYDPEYNEIDWDQPYRLDDSPVIPLGHFNHQQFFFLTACGAVKSLTSTEFNRNSIFTLVNGDEYWLMDSYPERNNDLRLTVDWDSEIAAEDLIGLCIAEGSVFEEKIRHMIQTGEALPISDPENVWPSRSIS